MPETKMNLNQVKPITYKVNEQNHVEIAGIDLVELVKKEGSPLYLLCEETIRKRAQAYENAFANYYPNHLSFYASKAMNCKALCKLVDQEGFGIDVVSEGELYTALSANFPAEKILFHGNNKQYRELELAIDNQIGWIVLDNLLELSMIHEIAKAKSDKAVNLMIRVTPGIECHTHEYIQTGHLDSKFGFNIEDLEDTISKIIDIQKECPNVQLHGLHAHIGSQIFETIPHNDTAHVLLELYKKIKDKFGIEFPDLNVGGGLGIKYTEDDDPPNIDAWVKVIADAVKKYSAEYSLKEPRVMVEPGRSLVGPAGLTIYTVGNIKDIPGIRKYVSVDGGMADNVRPIMYQAEYSSQIANKASDAATDRVTVAGKFCESGDVLLKDIDLPKLDSGDLLVIYSTGAYNYSMASNYNRATKPAVLLLKNGSYETIVQKETLEDIVKLDRLPQSWS